MSETRADPLFVEFLRRGPGTDFEAFLREHPDHEAQLRRLRDAYDATLAQLRAAGLHTLPLESTMPSAQLRAVSPASGELLRRIVAQGPKGSRYALRGEIARGGMGAILRVWDQDLGRELAMKVVLGSDGSSSGEKPSDAQSRRLSRFLEEAQITGQLDHPCVVPVHELGLDPQGQVYFTMRLVKGRDFGQILDQVAAGESGWNRTRALGVLLRVCEAMAYAHSKGVVHRDLKPANVMVGNFGEVYVMDWGLARVLGREDAHDIRLRDAGATSSIRTARRSERGNESPLVTMEGDVVGTPAYMPPEQARGRIEQVSARSDVYAIGAMLYHLLATSTPYVERGKAPSNFAVLESLLEGPPRPLREVCDDLPAELEAICEKAMAREPSQRYADTLDLAEDLRAYLEGRVVRAYQTGALIELRKWVLRNRALAAVGAAAGLFLIVGTAVSLNQKSKADANAVLAAERAEDALRKGALADRNRELAESRERAAASSEKRARAIGDFMTGLLASASPVRSMKRDVRVSEIVHEAAARLSTGEFRDDPQTEFALRMTLGDAYQSIDLLEESERQYRIAVELLAKLPDEDPATGVRLDIELADTLIARGDYAAGAERVRGALERLAAALPDDADTQRLHGRGLQALAQAQYNLGDTAVAIETTRRAIELRARSDGPESELAAKSRARLGFYLIRDGQFDAAMVELESALARLSNGSPSARLEASSVLRQRADVYASRRRYREATVDLEAALAQRTEVFGPDSLPVADVLEDLASAELHQSRPEAAEERSNKALELRRRLLGDHRDTATSLTTRGGILRAQERFDEARAAFEEAMAMRSRIFPPGSPAIGDSMRRLGGLERQLGNWVRAEQLYRDCLANWERNLGVDHPDVADARFDLARVLRAKGEYAEAQSLVESALASRIKTFGERNGGVHEARDELVCILLDSKQFEKAESSAREQLARVETYLAAEHPLLGYMKAQRGAALVGLERYDEAEPLLLAGWSSIGEDPRYWAVNKLLILDNLIALYRARGDAEKETLYAEKAAALRR